MSDATDKAARAAHLLQDALLIEVLDEIEQAAIKAWASTKMGDVEHREMAYHSLKASRRVRDALQGVVDNGLVAASRVVRPAGTG